MKRPSSKGTEEPGAMGLDRIFSTDDVVEVVVEVPERHQHIRATLKFRDRSSITFQEATVASLVRAYISIKTHPCQTRIVLRGQTVQDGKPGYAEWQLLEE